MIAFPHQHYVLSARCRQGEFTAVGALDNAARADLTPLWEVQPLYDRDDGERAAVVDIEKFLEKLPGNIARACLGGDGVEALEAYVDTAMLHDDDEVTGGVHPLVWLCEQTYARGTLLVPVTGPERDKTHHAAAKQVHAKRNTGIAVRLTGDDILNAAIGLRPFVTLLGLNDAQIDVIADLEYLAPTVDMPRKVADMTKALNAIASAGQWRNVILLAGSFPVDLTGLGKGVISLRRVEWELWRTELLVNQRATLARLPSYGDYGIAHPMYQEPPDFFGSAAIRYTTRDAWLIFRAGLLRDKRLGGFKQFFGLCKLVIAHAAYHGPAFSSGDHFINECAARRSGPGNLTTWRFVGTSQHATFAAQQVASSP